MNKYKKKKLVWLNRRHFFLVFFIVFTLFTEMSYARESTKKYSEKTLNKTLSLAKQKAYHAKYDEAIMIATKVISASPKYVPGYMARAKIWIEAGSYVQAIKDFTNALRIEPKKLPHVYRYRGDCLLEIGQYQRAIKDYSKSLYLSPKLYKSYYYRARAYALIGDNQNALKDINRGLSLRSHHSEWFIKLRNAILKGQPIPYNKPVSN